MRSVHMFWVDIWETLQPIKLLQKMETDSVVSGAEQSDLNNLNVILDKNPEQCRKSSQVLNH